MSIVDLSALPAPDVLEPLDFEDTYDEALGTFRDYMGDNWSAPIESEPVVKVLEVGAYMKVANRARVNDGCKALLLAHAIGPDLDHLGANYNLKRLVIQAEDLSAVPPVPEVKEQDDPFRERIQLAFEGLTTAGPRASYILHARNASGLVMDATAESPAPCYVTVTVLSSEGKGVASAELLATVKAALNDEDVRPVCDRVTVQSAQIIDYRIDAILHMAGVGLKGMPVWPKPTDAWRRGSIRASAWGSRWPVRRSTRNCTWPAWPGLSWSAGRIWPRPRRRRRTAWAMT